MAASVLEISMEANKQIAQELKEGLKEGIQGTINVLRKLKLEDAEIQTMIMEQYNLTENEVKEYL